MMRNAVLFTLLFCAFAGTTNAQNYYPADIGNIWVLESEDSAEQITYAIGTTHERFNGEQGHILRITSAILGTGSENASTFSMQVDEEGIKLHKIVTEFGDIFGTARVTFSPPALFFPAKLEPAVTWEIRGETLVNLIGNVIFSSVSEIVAVEDVDTPRGTFKNCLKIQMRTKSIAALGASRSTSYQWLAPDIGPVKLETDQNIVFELVRSNLIGNPPPYDVNVDGVVDVLDLTLVVSRFGQTDPQTDVNADGTVNILDLTLVARNLGN